MLRGLRNATSNWLGKAVMAAVVGFLILSFAIWGIGDMLRGSARSTVATIGSTEISAEQFRQIYNDRIQQLSRQIGRPVTPDQARAIGYDQTLLGQLIAEAAIDQRAQALGLGVSNEEVARRIREDPSFRGITGEFDHARFEQMIRQVGYTEPKYVAEQRRVALRRQIAGAINGGATVPAAAIEAVNRYQNEERAAEYVTLTAASVGEIAAPSPEVLQKYFDDRKVTFRAPEFRKVLLLDLNAEAIAKTIEIPAEDIKRAYESRLARYSTPERREVQQIVFPNEDEARKAAEKLAGGASFDQIATERGLKPSDISLGLVAKSAILDPAIADAAFALKANDVSAPVAGRFGVALVRVTRIEPGSQRSFVEAEAEVKNELALERAKTEVSKRRDKIEDELAAGSRLDEVAQKLGIPLRTVAAVDRSGRDPDGNLVAGLPTSGDMLSTIFASDVGVENDPVQTPGGFVWFEVAGITPSRERSVDEVKARVEARWRSDEIAARLKAKADVMLEKLKGGASLQEVAAANDLKIDTATGIKRRGAEALPAGLVAAIFQTAKGAYGNAEGKSADERVIFRVTDVKTPAFDSNAEDAKRISEALRNAISDELFTQYVAKIESEIGTTINRAALNQAIGASGSQ
jgi:peptidyl-prolyl cis-trans isomerase D